MSFQRFEDDCPGCRPVLIDIQTREVMGDDTRQMQALLRVWSQTSRFEREVYHRVMCQNSRTAFDMAVMQEITARIQVAMRTVIN